MCWSIFASGDASKWRLEEDKAIQHLFLEGPSRNLLHSGACWTMIASPSPHRGGLCKIENNMLPCLVGLLLSCSQHREVQRKSKATECSDTVSCHLFYFHFADKNLKATSFPQESLTHAGLVFLTVRCTFHAILKNPPQRAWQIIPGHRTAWSFLKSCLHCCEQQQLLNNF